MKVGFWGVRGSYPVPGPSTNRYGGNTSCVQVILEDGPIIIIDAGTGIRLLGKQLMEGPCGKGQGEVHLLISHTHWDHVQGLPFFAPLHREGNLIRIYSRRQDDDQLNRIFAAVTDVSYFPIPIDEMKSRIEFVDLDEHSEFWVGDTKIRCRRLNHPSVAMAYRLDSNGESVVYASDTAPFRDLLMEHEFIAAPPGPDKGLEPEDAALLAKMRHELVELCRNADVVIYDTHFTREEYEDRPHWGHSTPEQAMEIISEAGAKKLFLFHHSPQHTDEMMDEILRETRLNGIPTVDVDAAREGEVIEIRRLRGTP